MQLLGHLLSAAASADSGGPGLYQAYASRLITFSTPLRYNMGAKKGRAAFLLLSLLPGLAAAKAWSADSFPNPKQDPVACGRSAGQTGAVCDPDAVLSAKSKDYISGVLQAIWDGDKPYVTADCAGKQVGYQVAAAVMRKMDLPPGTSPADAARSFAKDLHARWGVGDAACNNGVLLLLAIDDRQVYVSTGTGAMEALPDGKIEDIVGDIRPLLRRQDYDGAVERAVVDIGLSLAGGAIQGEGGLDWFAVAFFGVFAAVFGNACFKSVRRKREYRECKRMLAKLKREQENLRSHAWSCPQSCPICLEDFTTRPRGGGDASGKDKAKGSDGDEASTSASAPPLGDGGLDEEAGPSTSLLHSSSANSEEEFARMSAAGQAAVRRLRQRRRAGGSSGAGASSSGGGWAEGAGPSTAAATGAKEDGRQQRLPVTLGCGHTFCEPCIEQWLEKGVTCPVCRKPISEGSGSEADQAATQSAAAQRARLADDWLAADLAFRLGVLQTRYPLYITPSMVDTWRSEAQSTGTFSFETHRDFLLNDPGARQHYESIGHGGFSNSFGGGSGFGGGGGGGSW